MSLGKLAALGLGAALMTSFGARADAKHEEGFGELTVDQVADLIARKDADIFDNNSKSDFDKGHVPTARWVAFNQVKASDLPADKSRKLVFYCANPH
ncbi:MAG TPA: rhodanese-like domain-containing protein [Myxococcales bacterium]|nr:rhodanese-like domain-containing protein [Myxococcales bacterium]HET9754000.1 rhodanese-like domain-containing protein [Myxococcales bacterium]